MRFTFCRTNNEQEKHPKCLFIPKNANSMIMFLDYITSFYINVYCQALFFRSNYWENMTGCGCRVVVFLISTLYMGYTLCSNRQTLRQTETSKPGPTYYLCAEAFLDVYEMVCQLKLMRKERGRRKRRRKRRWETGELNIFMMLFKAFIHMSKNIWQEILPVFF